MILKFKLLLGVTQTLGKVIFIQKISFDRNYIYIFSTVREKKNTLSTF